MTCKETFSALDSLSDDITTLLAAAPPVSDSDEIIDDDTDISVTIEAEAEADDETSIESMEFDAPEQTWTTFFLDNNAANSADNDDREPIVEAEADTNDDKNLLELQTSNQNEWQNLLGELADDAATPAADALEDDDNEIPIIPAWLSDELPAETSDQHRVFQFSWTKLGTGAALALLLAGQWLHYNRDALAANEIYGATVRKTYAMLGIQLYPDWPLEAFAVTGTEAITGRSSPDALDILANVIVSGRQPIGLPLIRVELHDLWSSPVASRIFTPAEYLRDFDTKTSLINPGTALPVDISVTDPGAEALGYVVDVCLPRRKTGLECQITKDPFQ